jgi:hypothetical protein
LASWQGIAVLVHVHVPGYAIIVSILVKLNPSPQITFAAGKALALAWSLQNQ